MASGAGRSHAVAFSLAKEYLFRTRRGETRHPRGATLMNRQLMDLRHMRPRQPSTGFHV
jgi:hypothetical protein